MAPEAIAQTTTGTSRMRPSVMRLGILKAIPARGRAPAGAGNASFPWAEYNGARTIARLAIPPLDTGVTFCWRMIFPAFGRPAAAGFAKPGTPRSAGSCAHEGHDGRKSARLHLRA